MSLDAAAVGLAFDGLPIASHPAFRSLVAEGRLRHSGPDGAPDLIDDLSARLVCSALRVGGGSEALVVFPDTVPRRSPLLFATALVMDAMAHFGATGHRRVLYLSNDAGIRTQLAKVRVGALSLDAVFAQQHGRGRAQALHPVSLPGGVHLPDVVSVCAPADPVALLREHKPHWVALDGGEATELDWLAALLADARRLQTPVVGWTTRPFSQVVTQWCRTGGGVLRWPSLRGGATSRISRLGDLSGLAVASEITPRLLRGDHVHEISLALAAATEALLTAGELQEGRLSTDATALGWRYLRAIETVPVPLDVYEREAPSYWGVRRLTDLCTAFQRFVDAVQPISQKLHAVLLNVADALSQAMGVLAGAEPPLWLGLANLCIESGRRRIVFSSKSRRDMFSLCLLARFNISEDDLRRVGVSLDYLGGYGHDEVAAPGQTGADKTRSDGAVPLLVGLPSRFAERHLDLLFRSGAVEVVLWPHQERVLAHRVKALSSQLAFSSRGLKGILPDLEDGAGPPRTEGLDRDRHAALRLGTCREALAGGPHDELRRRAASVDLWKRPDAAEAITSLFEALPDSEDAEAAYAAPSLDDAQPTLESQDSAWVPQAYELAFEDGRTLLLARDQTVNVILRKQLRAEIEERYVRAIRPGDEILFIHGQQRQSLYDLLVSRVHRDPVIAQYLALIRRWQDDLVRAFSEAESRRGLSPERLLADLQARGSTLTSPQTIRTWLRRHVLAPNDVDDLVRVAETLSMGFVSTYFRQIHKAARRLKGLHINLSARLNRWLASGEAGAAAVSDAETVVDLELGLTIDDFRHSLVRLRVTRVTEQEGPFYRPHMGRLEGGPG